MLSSCTLALFVRLENASSQAIFITQLAPESVSPVIEPGDALELRALMNSAFTVTRAGKAHWYQLHQTVLDLPGFDRGGSGLFPKRVVGARYAEDGCIYLLPVKHDAAVPLRDVQPDGFPLCAGKEVIKPGGIRRQ